MHQLTATKKALVWYEDAPKRLSPKSLWLAKKRDDSKPVNAKFEMFETPKQQILDLDDTKSAGRKKDTQIYHFLVGNKAMASYTDKVVKALKKDEIEHINKWRKEFIKPYESGEVKKLLALSLAIDKLWQEQTRHISDMKKKTTDTIHVWGQPEQKKQQTDIEYKDTVFEQEKLSADVKNSSPYMRLKLVMDYWCSLWFWPIDEAEKLPTRSEFLKDISRIVEKQTDSVMDFDKKLFSDTMDEEILQSQLDELGFIDVNELVDKNSRLQVVQEVSVKQKFLHWELEFADVFAKKGGFDLILGNPPWLLVRWEENGIMGEANPLFDIRSFSATELNILRKETFQEYHSLEKEYISEYESSSATQNFLGSTVNYPLIDGKTNLYKCFLPIGWKIANQKGINGFLHPEGVYDDPKGGRLRVEIYKRLKYHLQFRNALNLFSEVHPSRKYSINILNNSSNSIDFINISNLFIPKTINSCFDDSGLQPIEGIKDRNNKWNLKGYRNRILRINNKVLELFNMLYSAKDTLYNQARLPVVYSLEFISILEKFAYYSDKLIDIKENYFSTTFFDETQAQKEDIIKRSTCFIEDVNQIFISGSQFFVGNPLLRTPRSVCTQNSHYDVLDLEYIADSYLPRTNYIPNSDKYIVNIPKADFLKNNNEIIDFYRIVFRSMIDPEGERTLISTIIPPGIAHINAIRSFTFSNNLDLLKIDIVSKSIIMDYFTKSTGLSNLGNSIFENMPLISLNREMIIRTLSLTCLTTYYRELYEEQYSKEFTLERWTKKDDPRLNYNFFANLTPNWQRYVALRTDYERRQALVEIDVLVAQELKLTLEELKTIYRIQFPVLKQNENETFYDMNGRIVFTVSKGLTGVGLPRYADKKATPYNIVIEGKETEAKPLGWEDIINMQTGEIHRTITDDTMPNGPIERTIIYKAPFAKCDREKDYEVAWSEFEKREGDENVI